MHAENSEVQVQHKQMLLLRIAEGKHGTYSSTGHGMAAFACSKTAACAHAGHRDWLLEARQLI